MQIPFDIAIPAFTRLHTRSLSCIYDKGNIRYIKAGNTKLICMIYSAVRDTGWGTIPYHITHEDIQQNEESFIITYTAQFQQNNILFEASYRIEGTADDSISFEMKGISHSRFLSNRIGLCLHLPVEECKSQPVIIVTDSGDEMQAMFPANINPHQPFSHIQQMHWQTTDGKKILLLFEGEVFEAEDQRNWMDNSYKIYNRLLHLPFPFNVEKGYAMQQKVLVRFSKDSKKIVQQNIQTSKDEFVPVLPLGFAAADEPALLSPEEVQLLSKLPFAHYRAEADFETDWKSVLEIHRNNSAKLNTSLELILFFTDDFIKETEALIQVIASFPTSIKSILPLHKKHKVTPVFLQQYFYPSVKDKFPHIKIGYGTDAYFTELNRSRPENDLFDFVSFSINPQVHASDTNTLLENIGSIPYMMATIKSFTDKPVHVSPVTFKKRKNHDAAAGDQYALVDNFDKRQHTGFGAGWFLLCLYELHEAAQVSFFKTTGVSGMVRSAKEVSPLFIVLQQLKLFSPVAMMKKNEEKIIVFKNKRNEELKISFENLFFKYAQCW